jgi:hypothetical protein
MNNAIKILTFSIFIIFLLFDSAVLKAESSISAENCAAQAHLNFRITIPETLFLQVGALQPDAGSKSFSIKNKNESDLAESGKKKLTVKAVGSLSGNGSMHLSSSISDPDDKKGTQPQKAFEYLWSAGRVDRIGSSDTQWENKYYSLSSTHTGHFTFHYSSKKDVRKPSKNRIHSYTLCSP